MNQDNMPANILQIVCNVTFFFVFFHKKVAFNMYVWKQFILSVITTHGLDPHAKWLHMGGRYHKPRVLNKLNK